MSHHTLPTPSDDTTDSTAQGALQELPAVRILRRLNIFSPDQAAAYRESFGDAAKVLGPIVETKLTTWLRTWAAEGRPGAVILTGNAGTGKTAAAEAYASAAGGKLPTSDELTLVSPGRWVGKDLSGLEEDGPRNRAVRDVLAAPRNGDQALLCANEGVLRDTSRQLQDDGHALGALLDEALRVGAAEDGDVLVINANRQRITAAALWDQLCDYVTREELWAGCHGCPGGNGCPMLSNALALRSTQVRGQLRTLVRLAAGEAVPTIREVLGILAYAVVGGLSCQRVQEEFRDRGKAASTARHAYYNLILGGQLPVGAAERSPLMTGLRASGLGAVSDLQVDGWLRDTGSAPAAIRILAGAPEAMGGGTSDRSGISDSASPLDRVTTRLGTLTFHALGEVVSTDEDDRRVDAGLDALVVSPDTDLSCQGLWRARVYFEAPKAMGGSSQAAARLLSAPFFPELAQLADDVSADLDYTVALRELVRGLNFLVTGFASPNEGLIVPDPACLFARDPGSFRPARPSFVHSTVNLDDLSLRVPDVGLVKEVLDVDHVDVQMIVRDDDDLVLQVRPRLFEAVRQAALYRGPAGQGVAEMTDLRSFYGRLAASSSGARLRVADPAASPPSLVTVNLPRAVRRHA